MCFRQPKSDTRARIVLMIDHALNTRTLPSAEAAKLRGLHGWADTHTTGRCGRVATLQLKQRQYSEERDIDEILAQSLAIMRRISLAPLPWRIPIACPARRPLVVYSDASFEPESGQPQN